MLYFFFLFWPQDVFFWNNAQKSCKSRLSLGEREKIFHLEISTQNIFFCCWRLNLLIFVTFISSPVWWQSRWWFMTNDGWTSPPRWLCSGSWCAIGPWPPCISAITMDGFWFVSNSSLILCSCKKILLRFFALISLSCYGFNLIFICWRHFFLCEITKFFLIWGKFPNKFSWFFLQFLSKFNFFHNFPMIRQVSNFSFTHDSF